MKTVSTPLTDLFVCAICISTSKSPDDLSPLTIVVIPRFLAASTTRPDALEVETLENFEILAFSSFSRSCYERKLFFSGFCIVTTTSSSNISAAISTICRCPR